MTMEQAVAWSVPSPPEPFRGVPLLGPRDQHACCFLEFCYHTSTTLWASQENLAVCARESLPHHDWRPTTYDRKAV